jgi:hypothetical protein
MQCRLDRRVNTIGSTGVLQLNRNGDRLLGRFSLGFSNVFSAAVENDQGGRRAVDGIAFYSFGYARAVCVAS